MIVAAVASTGAEALARVEAVRPEVVLVDIFLGGESGLELTRRLAEEVLDATVILISTHREADLAELIATSPAAGFLPKAELSADAIRRMLDGRAA